MLIQKGERFSPALSIRKTAQAVHMIKKLFEEKLAKELNLSFVEAPLFFQANSGVNDDLNGIERPVTFTPKDISDAKLTIAHSLAKWKRIALYRYSFSEDEGLYTNMRAIRADEELDAVHSLYVDQWDWERVITAYDRRLDFLKFIVKKIYKRISEMEFEVFNVYPRIKPILPTNITFVHTEELEEWYPNLSRKERENKVCKKYGAVFLIGIGGDLKDGEPHDGRAPDYDDWTTPTYKGFKGLNGDILVWNTVLQRAFELSSMGIRVDKAALKLQLKLRKLEKRKKLLFHALLLGDKLPLSIGGGIGQSRLCMFLLRKNHIGEVQSSVWPDSIVKGCLRKNIFLL